MCGIAGFLSDQPQQAETLYQMTRIIRHRGPDDEGYVLFHDSSAQPVIAGGPDTPEQAWFSNIPYSPKKRIEQLSDMPVRFALGHRRLSIIDLSVLGHQPMSYRNGRYWIVYNGEIYNYIALRSELESLGHSFISQSDTEVILASYDQWGADCLHRFNGMWAFAIFDSCEREIFIARDRFGVKPLYYWIAPNGTFFFCSEIKQFTTIPGWVAHVNHRRAYDFLVLSQMDHTDETMFLGVYQLPPGYAMHLRVSEWKVDATGRVAVEKWYDLKPSVFSGTFSDAARELYNLFNDSILLRLRSDVPVGSCLSGGLDSSSIVCLINNTLHDRDAKDLQKTFSVCADIKRFDEREWIEEVVRHIDVDAYFIYPSMENLFNESPTITWNQDEPFISTSIFAQWNVFRLAAQNGVKVMLDGQGADELFAGYHGFFWARFADLFLDLKLLRLWREIQRTKYIHGYSEGISLVSMSRFLLPPSFKNSVKRLTGISSQMPSWLNLDALDYQLDHYIDDLAPFTSRLNTLSYNLMTVSSIPMLLHWEDRDSMAHSVESRVPFLDYRLVEFVLGLPDDFKLSDGITKRILRKCMEGVVPDKILNRMDKMGFVTPEETWIKEQAPDMFHFKLRRAIDSSQGILSTKALPILEETIAGRISFSSLIWRMINFGEWMEKFSVINTYKR